MTQVLTKTLRGYFFKSVFLQSNIYKSSPKIQFTFVFCKIQIKHVLSTVIFCVCLFSQVKKINPFHFSQTSCFYETGSIFYQVSDQTETTFLLKTNFEGVRSLLNCNFFFWRLCHRSPKKKVSFFKVLYMIGRDKISLFNLV